MSENKVYYEFATLVLNYMYVLYVWGCISALTKWYSLQNVMIEVTKQKRQCISV